MEISQHEIDDKRDEMLFDELWGNRGECEHLLDAQAQNIYLLRDICSLICKESSSDAFDYIDAIDHIKEQLIHYLGDKFEQKVMDAIQADKDAEDDYRREMAEEDRRDNEYLWRTA